MSYLPITIPTGQLGINQLKNFNFKLPIPHVLLWAACGYSVLGIYRQAKVAWRSAITWFSSFFNAGAYLTPTTDNIDEMQEILNVQREPNSGPPNHENAELYRRSFAVIYGATNKAGKAFALHLASKGFNLILIERQSHLPHDVNAVK